MEIKINVSLHKKKNKDTIIRKLKIIYLLKWRERERERAHMNGCIDQLFM